MHHSLLLAGDSTEIVLEPSPREDPSPGPFKQARSPRPGQARTDVAGALRRLTIRKVLRRLTDFAFDLRATRSPRFALGLFTTNWHSGHDALLDIFRRVDVRPGDVLADIGCGKGRVVAFLAARYPGRRVIGVEMDDTALFARQAFSDNPDIEIRHASLEDAFPREANIFFLFPPTDGDLPHMLKALIDEHARRDVLVVAKGAMGDLAEFQADPSWSIERIDPPDGVLARLASTHFIYGHHVRGPGYHYGLLLRKSVQAGGRPAPGDRSPAR